MLDEVASLLKVSRAMAYRMVITGVLPAQQLCAGALVHLAGAGRDDPNPKRLGNDQLATNGIWASGRQHSVQNCHANGSLGLLGGEAAGS